MVARRVKYANSYIVISGVCKLPITATATSSHRALVSLLFWKKFNF